MKFFRNASPSPLRGRDRVGGKARGANTTVDSVDRSYPPTLTLPRKGGGDFAHRR